MADVGDFLEQVKADGFDIQLDPEVITESLYVTMTPQKLADTNPFGDVEVYSCELTSEVNVAQLTDEISKGAGFDVQLSVANPRPGTAISADNPAKIYIYPPVDGRLAHGRIRSHRIDDLYGLTSDQRDRIVLKDKLRRGEELSKKELARALRLALTSP